MTLVVSVNSPETIWLLADRRLSSIGHTVKDDARKVMLLETTDGMAILGYAGLGATAHGTEPSDWMSAVLRGRNLPLEQALGVLADAMKKQLPRHMLQILGTRGPTHHVIVAAFVGNEPRLYTIDLVFAPDHKRYDFLFTRRKAESPTPTVSKTPRIAIGGSGSQYLIQDQEWVRSLLRLVKASDRGQVSPRCVADYLANLNYKVHLEIPDKSVGPRCIVVWRHRKEGAHSGGGEHRCYTGTKKDADTPSLPTIANGMDVSALIGAIMPHMTKVLEEALGKDGPVSGPDEDELNAAVARLPDKPDENLR